MTPQTDGYSLAGTFPGRRDARVTLRRCAVNLFAVAMALLPGVLAWLVITTPNLTAANALISLTVIERSSPAEGPERHSIDGKFLRDVITQDLLYQQI